MFKLHFIQAMHNFHLYPISRLFMTQITLVDDTVYSYDFWIPNTTKDDRKCHREKNIAISYSTPWPVSICMDTPDKGEWFIENKSTRLHKSVK